MIKSLDRAFAAAHLFKADDLALVVALEQGLDLQHGTHGRGQVGKTPAALEIAQVVHREHLADAEAAVQQPLGRGVHTQAELAVAHGPDHQQPLAQRGAQRIDKPELAVGKLLPQIRRRDRGGVERAADAGGHADEEDVAALLQLLPEEIGIALRGDLRGRHDLPSAHVVIKGLSLKMKIRRLFAVNHKGIGDTFDFILTKKLLRQVCRGVGHDGKAHGKPPSVCCAPRGTLWAQYTLKDAKTQTPVA